MADLDLIPTDPCAIEKKLRHVRALMQLERKEDLPDWALESGIERIRLQKLSRRISKDGLTAATNRIGLDAAEADRLAQCAKVMANVYDAKLPI